jgi:uncharacterized protein (DUF2336 family)
MAVAFETLKELARERSPVKRSVLLHAITATFLETPQRTPTEVDLFDDIMNMVLDDVEPLARQELAERLADLHRAPRRTLVRLAGDEIEIAGPVLTRSPALADNELEPIARERSQDHLLAIAMRKSLSERLTDILVHRGNDRVASTVVANDGARFSPDGFATLASRATESEAILNRLAMRRDLPEQIAVDLLPLIESTVAEKIESAKAGIDARTARRLVEEARERLADRLRAATRSARPLAILKSLVDRGDLTLAEAITELADADQMIDLAAYLGVRLRLSSGTIARNLFGESEETLMLICRAAGLNVDAFSSVLRMRRRRKRGTAPPADMLKSYLRVPRAMAENVVRIVREREGAKASA